MDLTTWAAPEECLGELPALHVRFKRNAVGVAFWGGVCGMSAIRLLKISTRSVFSHIWVRVIRTFLLELLSGRRKWHSYSYSSYVSASFHLFLTLVAHKGIHCAHSEVALCLSHATKDAWRQYFVDELCFVVECSLRLLRIIFGHKIDILGCCSIRYSLVGQRPLHWTISAAHLFNLEICVGVIHRHALVQCLDLGQSVLLLARAVFHVLGHRWHHDLHSSLINWHPLYTCSKNVFF